MAYRGVHRLRELRIAGAGSVLARVPDFDLHRLGKVVSLSLEASRTGEGYDVTLLAIYEDGIPSVAVRLQFRSARQVIVPEISPTLWLSELEIEDLSADQLEGISFRAKDFGGGFEVSCAEVLIAIDG